MKKNLLFALTILLLLGCSTEKSQNATICDIAALNSDLKSEIGLDILAIKAKTDSVYEVDKQFYEDLLVEIEGGPKNNCFERAKIPFNLKDVDGIKLPNSENYDSLANRVMSIFAQNMIMDECSANTSDSFCRRKKQIYEVMSGKTETQLTYSTFFSTFDSLNHHHNLNKEEFHYLILYFHYLGAIIDESQKISLTVPAND